MEASEQEQSLIEHHLEGLQMNIDSLRNVVDKSRVIEILEEVIQKADEDSFQEFVTFLTTALNWLPGKVANNKTLKLCDLIKVMEARLTE